MSTRKTTTTTSVAPSDGTAPVVYDAVSLFDEEDRYLFGEGTHEQLYRKFGAHLVTIDGVAGAYFAVWAPNATSVAVMGDFNNWNQTTHLLQRHETSGIWEGFIPQIGKGATYKYHIIANQTDYRFDKADPFAIHAEVSPNTGSKVWDLAYEWGDASWMAARQQHNALNAPISIYEVHLGSWQRIPEEGNRYLTYRELAPRLTDYVKRLGFTHVELLPVMEHPFYGSWGYQTTGYFAPTSRYGTPQDFMYLVDHLHQNGIGVILDWVPSHFSTDGYGLGYFDGTHLYEHPDPRRGHHPDWDSNIFDYGRNEVRSFLISNALYWLDVYHIDGIRVDAVASMLYLNYSRRDGEWLPNQHGGHEHLEAIHFLQQLNTSIYRNYPDVQTFAEESTSWPMVSRPIYVGGLGFGAKWDMGWMHDTLDYMSLDPILRRYHHDKMTFRMLYAFSENFVLPISHDEVVHGKGSLVGKMPGNEAEKIANVRALLGYMYGQPAKKLLFMGSELGQWSEWAHEGSVEWHLEQYGQHRGLQDWVSDLNRVYREEVALHGSDFEKDGFAWIDTNDAENSVFSFVRQSPTTNTVLLVVCHFTPVPRYNYHVGVPHSGFWQELLNSDAVEYGGAGYGNMGGVKTVPVPVHDQFHSLTLTLPPFGVLFFKSIGP
ncbi:MAG: 1,4-alpha-glucan branching protein GlgB [Chloroflexota bacterium]